MTKIEWTDETWNPVVGCSKISPGCDNCYALRMARRLAEMPHTKKLYAPVTCFGNGDWNGEIAIAAEKVWDKPLHWKNPRRVFVCSMGDLFHEEVDYDAFARIMAIAAVCDRHTYLILTKRPERMRELVTAWCSHMKNGWPRPNIWLGVTAENQVAADERIPILLDTPAAVRFVSCEPMLGPIDMYSSRRDYLGPIGRTNGPVIQRGLDWVICGGESGPGARPMHPDWARILRDQCKAANVPFFFKQWGDATVAGDHGCSRDAKKGGRILDKALHAGYPKGQE